MVKQKEAPPVQPVTDPKLAERYKRRLHTPGSLAPRLRARQIHILSWACSIPLAGYVVLFADFGQEEHCFSPLRRWFESKRQQFWTLTPQEQAELKEQGRA
ncbi:hypothetical protein BCR43DRAFT_563974 [Syncephalastrum racemosum]|uniref:Uncharacterized protein n=1 Tax=Syncephalastrum racemosum TaxID=13706 RepID=A0A1X2HD43_SYNRA|nr:hypothetical protein BCR43DRAFT_563974 [Syncephalastrum racemosum]